MEKEHSPEDVTKEPLELVKEVKKELADYRSPFEKEWREYDDAYYGKQHKTGEGVKSVKNHIFKIIEGEVPILTDSMPGTQVDAEQATRQVDADILNKSIRHVYQDQNLPLLLPTLVRSALISAPGWLYAFYNPDANGGEGKIEYRQLPWDCVSVDGNAQTIEQADRARIKIPMRRDSIARGWPEHREKILGQIASKDNGSHSPDTKEDSDNAGSDVARGKPARHKAKDIVDYVETWVKSYDLEDIPQEEIAEEIEKEYSQFANGEVPNIGKWENHDAHDQAHLAQRGELLAQLQLPPDAPIELVSQTIDQLTQANPEAQLGPILLSVKMIDNHREEHAEMKKLNPTGQRPKYKDGWRLLKTCGDVVLYDGGNPEERDGIGHIPLVPFYGYKDDTIYGFGEVKNIINAQRSHNEMDQYELDGLKTCTNPGWIYDQEAGIKGKLTNEPGIEIEKKKGTEVRRLEPGQVSPQLEQRKFRDAEFMEDASGVNRESQGNMASSASGIAITKLQTQAIGRIRLKDRYLQYYSMRRLAIITAQLILNNWTTEKAFRLRTDDSQVEDIVFDPLKMADLGYSVSISPGSMAGIDKDAMNGFFRELLQGQHITYEEFLLVADFPKKEILLTKLRERMEKEQTLEQVQGELQTLQAQNASLLGLVSPDLIEGDQKKVFEISMKQALIEKLMAQQQPQPMEQIGANQGQPSNQEIA